MVRGLGGLQCEELVLEATVASGLRVCVSASASRRRPPHESAPPGSATWLDSSAICGRAATRTSLTLDRRYNCCIRAGHLPPSLARLTFDYNYNQPFHVGVLPPFLTSLELGAPFSHPLPAGVLPMSLKTLNVPSRPVPLLQPGALPVRCTVVYCWAW